MKKMVGNGFLCSITSVNEILDIPTLHLDYIHHFEPEGPASGPGINDLGHGIWAMRPVLEGLGLGAWARSPGALPSGAEGLRQMAWTRGLCLEALGRRTWPGGPGSEGLGLGHGVQTERRTNIPCILQETAP